MKSTLKKIEGQWVIIIEYEDGSRNDYRFKTKAAALEWTKLHGNKLIDLTEEASCTWRVSATDKKIYITKCGHQLPIRVSNTYGITKYCPFCGEIITIKKEGQEEETK